MATLKILNNAGDVMHTDTIHTGSHWGARRVRKYVYSMFHQGFTVTVNGSPRAIVAKNGRYYTRIP